MVSATDARWISTFLDAQAAELDAARPATVTELTIRALKKRTLANHFFHVHDGQEALD